MILTWTLYFLSSLHFYGEKLLYSPFRWRLTCLMFSFIPSSAMSELYLVWEECKSSCKCFDWIWILLMIRDRDSWKWIQTASCLRNTWVTWLDYYLLIYTCMSIPAFSKVLGAWIPDSKLYKWTHLIGSWNETSHKCYRIYRWLNLSLGIAHIKASRLWAVLHSQVLREAWWHKAAYK